MRKKLGDKVLFTNQNVSGSVKQVARSYTDRVANPLTRPKAHHKALFTAAANFRTAFAGILDHSWQGKAYGITSLAHFMGIVTARHGDNFPGYFLQPREIRKPIPQPWPLATGSLYTGVDIQLIDYSQQAIRTTLRVPSMVRPYTYGDWSKAVLENNPGLKDGDMLTFLCFYCYPVNEVLTFSTRYFPIVDRLVIDTHSSASVGTNGVQTDNNVWWFSHSLEGVYIFWKNPSFSWDAYPVAAGLIVSRKSPSGRTWQRSNSVMKLADKFVELYSSDEYRENCIESFMNPEFLASDWYLNQLR